MLKKTIALLLVNKKERAVNRIALIAIIAVSNAHSQDFYFENDFYHKIDCSEKEACYISSYEKNLVWDSKINMDEIERKNDFRRIHYDGKYFGDSFEVTIMFYPREKELNILRQGEKISYRCQLTDKKQYICKDPVKE